MSHHTDDHPPYPRLSHCRPGTTVQLLGEPRLRTIEEIQGGYAYFNNGLLAIGLSHRVNQRVRVPDGDKWRVTDRQLMTFGEGGWKPLINTSCG